MIVSAVKRLSILTPDRACKIDPLSGTAEREHDRFLSLGDPQHQGREAIPRQGSERIEGLGAARGAEHRQGADLRRRQGVRVSSNSRSERLNPVRKTLTVLGSIRKPPAEGFPSMLVGYMRVSSDSDRQTTDLQRDALLSAGVDSRHLFEDHASGAKDDRCGTGQGIGVREVK